MKYFFFPIIINNNKKSNLILGKIIYSYFKKICIYIINLEILYIYLNKYIFFNKIKIVIISIFLIKKK